MRWLSWLACLGGCYLQGGASVRLHEVSPHGGQINGAMGNDTLQVRSTIAVYASGADDRVGGALGAALSASPIGYLHYRNTGESRSGETWAPIIDLGPSIGYTFGDNSRGAFWSGVFGGFLDVRVTEEAPTYWAIHTTVAREVYTANAPDVTVVTIGVAIIMRNPNGGFGVR